MKQGTVACTRLCRELDHELHHLVKGYDADVLGRLVKGKGEEHAAVDVEP
jgi:hypothetical protein